MRLESCLLAAGAVLMSAAMSEAQTIHQGHVLVGIGQYSNRFTTGHVDQFAAGAEALFPSNLGLGGEAALALSRGDGAFLLSLNATQYFVQRSSSATLPFVSGGYTRFAGLTESRGRNGWHVGAGVTHWFGSGPGVRVEIRDVLYRADGYNHVTSVRIGLALR